jgi:cell division control protein 6
LHDITQLQIIYFHSLLVEATKKEFVEQATFKGILNLLSMMTSMAVSPKKKSPTSPVKCSVSMPNPNTNTNGMGIDPNQLHTYYSTAPEHSNSGVCEPVSRSEFGDLVGVLEGVGLVCLAGSAEASSSSGARQAFGQSDLFGGDGAGFGGTGKGKSKGAGELRLANGVRRGSTEGHGHHSLGLL